MSNANIFSVENFIRALPSLDDISNVEYQELRKIANIVVDTERLMQSPVPFYKFCEPYTQVTEEVSPRVEQLLISVGIFIEKRIIFNYLTWYANDSGRRFYLEPTNEEKGK